MSMSIDMSAFMSMSMFMSMPVYMSMFLFIFMLMFSFMFILCFMFMFMPLCLFTPLYATTKNLQNRSDRNIVLPDFVKLFRKSPFKCCEELKLDFCSSQDGVSVKILSATKKVSFSKKCCFFLSVDILLNAHEIK